MKIKKIEIDFPCEVELPEGWDHALHTMLEMVCRNYERKNPNRVMWPAACGCKPTFLPLTDAEEEAGGMEFDESILHFGISEREDIHGRNRHNPNRTKIIRGRIRKNHLRKGNN